MSSEIKVQPHFLIIANTFLEHTSHLPKPSIGTLFLHEMTPRQSKESRGLISMNNDRLNSTRGRAWL
jgi:hypothetical protein